MMNELIKTYANTFPNIEKFYANNGGKDFVVQLFLDKSSILKKLSRVVSPTFLYGTYLFFEPLISALVVTGLFLKTLFFKKEKGPVETDNVKRLYLNYAHLLKDRCKSAGIFEESEYWLKEPFTNVSTKGLENKTVVSVYDVLKNVDFFRAYRLSVSAIFYVARHNPNRYIRRSYTAFEFYLTYNAISKFPVKTELVFANHIDRWAIVFDACPQTK